MKKHKLGQAGCLAAMGLSPDVHGASLEEYNGHRRVATGNIKYANFYGKRGRSERTNFLCLASHFKTNHPLYILPFPFLFNAITHRPSNLNQEKRTIKTYWHTYLQAKTDQMYCIAVGYDTE